MEYPDSKTFILNTGECSQILMTQSLRKKKEKEIFKITQNKHRNTVKKVHHKNQFIDSPIHLKFTKGEIIIGVIVIAACALFIQKSFTCSGDKLC